MCGIAGIMNFKTSTPVPVSALREMCDAIKHRGPDDEGVFTDGCIGLAMRRLSIVDLQMGHQPICNEDGTIWIVYNGEIYNHLDLRRQLESGGHIYRTRSDTETIVHLYEQHAGDCVHYLNGMFAFVIWDARRRRLFMARDRFGIKPLYYALTNDYLLFASEIKAIIAAGMIRPEFRRTCLPEYLAFGYLSGQDTFYNGIQKLMPGHTLEVDVTGHPHVTKYWDLAVNVGPQPKRPESYYVETYRGMLEQAVTRCMMSDVPLGVFLSGGVDSSSVAALASKARGGPVETFSVGYPEVTYSELASAKNVARHLGSLHHEIVVTREDFLNSLPKLIWHEDEPITWPSSVALYFAAQLAAERVKVVLTGEGSDETLAGYTRYAYTLKSAPFDAAYRRIVPPAVRRAVQNSIFNSPWLDAKVRRKLSHTFFGVNGEHPQSYYFDNFFAAFRGEEQMDLLTEELASEFHSAGPYANVLQYWSDSTSDRLRRLLYTDIKTYLVELLMKQDNMSMAASIESRVPFLDHILAEFAIGVPENFQIRGMSGKHILKKAMVDLLPNEILHRPKLGFPTPWGKWLAGSDLGDIEKLLLEGRSTDRGLIRPESTSRIFAEHRSGYRDNSDRIWRLLNLELWHRVCLERDPSAWPWHP